MRVQLRGAEHIMGATIETTLAQAYVAGWQACFDGEDGRFTNPFAVLTEAAYAWDHGFFDAMEADDDESPEPACVGYGGAK